MSDIRMGLSLGFISRIQLVDGTVMHNMQVRCSASVPPYECLEKIFIEADKTACEILREK